MFDHEHYVPVLKWKQGEYLALRQVSARTKRRITPVIEIQDIPWDYEDGCDSKTLDEHLGTVARFINTNWGRSPAFLDVEACRGAATSSGCHPMRHIADDGAQFNLRLVPVLRSSSSAQTLADAAHIHTTYNSGFAVRLYAHDFLSGSPATVLQGLQQAVGTTDAETDLLVDMHEIPADPAQS
ncbi:MAG: hypothetical protein EOO65_05080, partial [Methanosarcinales archaeon]